MKKKFEEIAKRIAPDGYRSFLYESSTFQSIWLSIITPNNNWLKIFSKEYGGYEICFAYIPTRELGGGCICNNELLYDISVDDLKAAEEYGRTYSSLAGIRPLYYEDAYTAMINSEFGDKYKELLFIDKNETLNNALLIKIKYHNDNPKLEHIRGVENSNWIDLYVAEDIVMQKGEFKYISLGISMEIPKGYEAHLSPRSSTFEKYGIIQTNSVGIIDTSYCGEDDIWMFPAYAVRPTYIKKGARICQFRLVKVQEPIVFKELDKLSGSNRGGLGSTGK